MTQKIISTYEELKQNENCTKSDFINPIWGTRFETKDLSQYKNFEQILFKLGFDFVIYQDDYYSHSKGVLKKVVAFVIYKAEYANVYHRYYFDDETTRTEL